VRGFWPSLLKRNVLDFFVFFFRAVAFMELVLLIIANLLIRTRLKVDPNAKRASFASIAKDYSFMLFLIG
jgi:hypothetical protein